MDSDSTETEAPDHEGPVLANITQYVQENKESTNTILFSYLALLNAYVPDSFLLMSECQKVLGPPDPIHGGPPFEERMKPFTALIDTSGPDVHLIHPKVAQRAVNILANAEITRSTTVKKLMNSLCGDEPEEDTVQFIKDLLTKRELDENGKIKKFSMLIEDIQEQEGSFYNAVSVLKSASDKFRQNPAFPQTLARLYYIKGGNIQSEKAETWAKEAISRAPKSSFVADTLGQIYKNRLLREHKTQQDIINRAEEAFGAFDVVEKKAEAEEGPEMQDTAGDVSNSDTFNNRGRFGFLQVAKITFEKLTHTAQQRYVQTLKTEVEDKFDFFEWYLTYSKPDMKTLEPWFFWKVVVLCYKHYTNKRAADSTSFPGLLDSLNRGLFTSKWSRAGFNDAEKTIFDLEEIRNDLKTNYENEDDESIKAAERYILSNIILANLNSPHLTPVEELKTIIHRFLGTEVGRRSSEFYLLVLLLFWPDGQPEVVQEEKDEEVEQHTTEDEGSEDKTWEDQDDDEDQEAETETAQVSPVQIFDPNLEDHVTFMTEAFQRGKYAKYLRGRYLLPLFFLGKGSGLSRWIHKSRLDKIVEEKVNRELPDQLAGDQDGSDKEKWRRINRMWVQGKVWKLPEVQDLLLPVQVEPCYIQITTEEREVYVCAGGKKLKVTAKVEPNALNRGTFYLGFTIQGLMVFKAELPPMAAQ